MTDPGAPPLNLKQLESRLRAEAGIFAVDSGPPGVLALTEEWALLRALRETRAALGETLKELAGAEWDGSLADSTMCCAWCKRERPWDTPEQDEALSHDADCVWLLTTGRAREILARVDD